MEKSYKIAHTKLRDWKICAKNAQNCAQLAKMAKIIHKRPKTFNKTSEKKTNLFPSLAPASAQRDGNSNQTAHTGFSSS